MKIAIFTTFTSFLPGYSLTGIVKAQAKMLAEYGHEVHLFVNERYNGEVFSDDVILEKKMPFAHLEDFQSIQQMSPQYVAQLRTQNENDKANKIVKLIEAKERAIEVFKEELANGYEIVFTHDFLFVGWNLPYGVACIEASKELPNVKWLHWVHSVPSANRDWWNVKMFGPRHKIVYPNETDRLRCAEQYKGQINDIRVIPHIKDMRSFFDFSVDTCEFLKQYPQVMKADIIQVLPASVDRLEAKRLKEVIYIFSRFKQMGFRVCLIVATQWCTGEKQREEVDKYRRIASRNDLKNGTDIIFSSDFRYNDSKTGREKNFGLGLPKNMVQELFLCSNLFIFPTREESFGLVVPEAGLSGVLLVLNKSLTMQMEISGYNALYFDFGSFHMNVQHENEDQYLMDIAKIIIGRIRENESLRAKTFMRKMYNWNALYENVYAPIMAESRTWL